MTTNHIDQLAQWWENAEKGSPRPGDKIIIDLSGGGYLIETASKHWGERECRDDTRILARAPKPAWHDAVAVIAHRQGDYGLTAREVYVSGVDDKWVSAHYYARTSELIDPTPLIEAKVTDEMVEKARDYMSVNTGQTHARNAIRGTLAAALGLEAE